MIGRLPLLVLLCAAFLPYGARAQETRIDVQWAVGSHHFTGVVGEQSSGSIGTVITQGIQHGYFGAYVGFGTDYHLTRQDPPPYARGLQTFSATVGARLQVPVGSFAPAVSVEYMNLAFATNPLSRYTGSANRAHAVGGTAGARWLLADPFFVEARGAFHALPGLQHPTFRLGYLFAIGLSGSI